MNFYNIAVFFLMLSTDFVLAEEISKQPVTKLDDVTVVGTRSEGIVKNNPHTITIMDRQEIEKNLVSSVAEALEGKSGIGTTDSNNAGTKRIRIRGESARRVTILIDGQELTDHSNHGTPILENISEVGKIEIVHGPASVLYGAKAIGGVVNIITKSGQGSKPVNGEISTVYYGDSNGRLFNSALFGQINHFNYRLAFYEQNHQDIKVPRSIYTSNLDHLEHTQTNSRGINLSLGNAFGERFNHSLQLKLESSKLSAQNWREPAILKTGFIPLTSFDINLPKRDKQRIGFFYNGEELGSVVNKVHFDTYYQKVLRGFENSLTSNIFENDKFIMSVIRGNVPSFVERMVPKATNILSPILKPLEFSVDNSSDDKLINYGGTFQVDFKFPVNHYIISGINYLSDRLESDKLSIIRVGNFLLPAIAKVVNSFSIPTEVVRKHPGHYQAHMNTLSVFFQDEWQLTDYLKVITGLRYYKISTALDRSSKCLDCKVDRENKLLKSMSWVYSGLANTSFRIGYSEGYITPNLMQLFISTDVGGVASLPNPKLRSETAKNIEFGSRYADDHFSFDGTLFLTKSNNYISLRSCRDNPLCNKGVSKFRPSSVYQNGDKAKTYGLELSMGYSIPNTGLSVYVDSAWLKRKETLAMRETYDTDTPKISGRVGLRYERKGSKAPYWVDFHVRGASKVTLAPELNPNNPGGDKLLPPLSGWITANLGAGVTYKVTKDSKLEVALKLNNITNSKYRSSFNSLPGSARNANVLVKWQF